MNKKILLLLFLTTLACSSKAEKPIPEKQLEGWAGNPDNPNEKPFDYFYMKSTARASEKSISKKNGEMMKVTCIDSATRHIAGDLFGKIIKDLTLQNHNLNSKDQPTILLARYDKTYLPFQTNFIHLINATDHDMGWVIHLVEEYAPILRNNVKTKSCKPFAIPDQEIYLSEWKECECIIYAHIPGGKDGVIARARELRKE